MQWSDSNTSPVFLIFKANIQTLQWPLTALTNQGQ